MVVTKWGFGSAPIKLQTLNKNKIALNHVRRYIMGEHVSTNVNICDEISVVKGLFNRILRQDQWDWFTINMYFDYPPAGEISKIVRLLVRLRSAILDNIQEEIDKLLSIFSLTNFCIYATNFITFDYATSDTDEYIYVLSRREDRDILKIGMTTRNVIKRCQEINSATGVIYPFSPRKVFRVFKCKQAEQLVHHCLAQYRIRSDREFFNLSYIIACEIIETCLKESNLMYYKY